ncbi:AAA family ATPase [Thermoflexibacter ruber]|uniref:Nicotinamide-nucleotide adenylyltransferase, NadR type n=1 Tax=Thermoflexibacter ruber TaxID=1003 RepID=A0A1I2J6W1_9BACT|nr:ATP-binding protein [Thermoflexibacter ruber]SFF48431.1 nicotinamide-nucleotide adenylyltransferase, NadR type [Thermoflexibacter ruber]
MNEIVKKVVIFGPESTGKTTLAKQLAIYFHTLWCPEFTRAYLTMKNHLEGRYAKHIVSTYADIEPMAIGQIALEDSLEGQAQNLIFYDTNLLTNLIYSNYYFQKHPAWLPRAVVNRKYDLYLLLDVDVVWEADPLRDRPYARSEMHALFKNALIHHQQNFIEIRGLGEDRLQNAVRAVRDFFKLKETQ